MKNSGLSEIFHYNMHITYIYKNRERRLKVGSHVKEYKEL